TLFGQDLNGDGHIGLLLSTIEAAGATTLGSDGTAYYLRDSGGSGPTLTFNGANVSPGEFGNWTPIGAEKTGSGYEIAWKETSTDQCTLWSTDNNGAFTANLTGAVAGSNAGLQSAETLFAQDLNGDGRIGLVLTMLESAGSTTLA